MTIDFGTPDDELRESAKKVDKFVVPAMVTKNADEIESHDGMITVEDIKLLQSVWQPKSTTPEQNMDEEARFKKAFKIDEYEKAVDDYNQRKGENNNANEIGG